MPNAHQDQFLAMPLVTRLREMDLATVVIKMSLKLF